MTQLEQDYMILASVLVGFAVGVGSVLLFNSINLLLDGLLSLLYKKYLRANNEKVYYHDCHNGDDGKTPN